MNKACVLSFVIFSTVCLSGCGFTLCDILEDCSACDCRDEVERDLNRKPKYYHAPLKKEEAKPPVSSGEKK